MNIELTDKDIGAVQTVASILRSEGYGHLSANLLRILDQQATDYLVPVQPTIGQQLQARLDKQEARIAQMGETLTYLIKKLDRKAD